jgi:hypothetical protein
MIVKRDYACPYSKKLKNLPGNLEEDTIFLYTDGNVVFWGIWEYADTCTQMAEGPCCHILDNVVLSEPRGYDYKTYPILVNKGKKEIQVSKIIYDDIKELKEESYRNFKNKIVVTNPIEMLEVLEV